jgi:hypothetical protein
LRRFLIASWTTGGPGTPPFSGSEATADIVGARALPTMSALDKGESATKLAAET